MLPLELARYPTLPVYHPYKQYVNIKKEFEACYGKFVGGMYNMLRALKMTLDGQHHSGIDDTRNITKILIRMLSDGHMKLRVEYV
jgi:inhibitor of KinA sporulation pathway (predicted exonuclease)